MIINNYSNRLFGRTRGRSKKKIDLKKYHQTVDKYKFQNCDKKINYILDATSEIQVNGGTMTSPVP